MKLYEWYEMSGSVHKLLIHGTDVMDIYYNIVMYVISCFLISRHKKIYLMVNLIFYQKDTFLSNFVIFEILWNWWKIENWLKVAQKVILSILFSGNKTVCNNKK